MLFRFRVKYQLFCLCVLQNQVQNEKVDGKTMVFRVEYQFLFVVEKQSSKLEGGW